MDDLVLRAGPMGNIPGGGGLLIGITGGPIVWDAGSMPGHGGPWGEGRPRPLQEEEQGMELGVSFLVELPQLSCQSGLL